MTLLDLLGKTEQGEDKQFLREGIKLLAQELMDAEVTQQAGAAMSPITQNQPLVIGLKPAT